MQTRKDTDTTLNQEKAGSPKYWQSLEQWRQDPEFLKMAEKEFVSSPLSSDEGKDGWARREFLKLMGASLALTSFGCIRRPAQKIVPYAKRPEEIVPGIANYYSSSFVDGDEIFGLIVKTREGRPIKVDGNPDFPLNKGGVSARAVSHILSLYDPDRLTSPKKNLLNKERTNRDTVSVTYEDLDKAVVEALKAGKAGVLSKPVTGPSGRALLNEFKNKFKTTNYYFNDHTQGVEEKAQQEAYGTAVTPRYEIAKADFILSLGADFLGAHQSSTAYTKQFSSRRSPGEDMNKLTVVESLLSLTGSNADERYTVAPGEELNFVMAVIYSLSQTGQARINSQVKDTATQFKAFYDQHKEAVDSVVADLVKAKGKSLVLTGGLNTQHEQALQLHLAVQYLNNVLGNDGKTVKYRNTRTGNWGEVDTLSQLAKDIESGKIETLIVNDVNFVYQLSSDHPLQSAVRGLKNVVYVGDRIDETGQVAHYVIPVDHPLETWNDHEPLDGLYLIQQPTIRPLYDSRSFEQSMIQWMTLDGATPRYAGDESLWFEYVQNYWKSNIIRGSFDNSWNEVLQNGYFDSSASARDNNLPSRNFNESALKGIKPVSSKESLVLYKTIGLRDGNLANVAWLQEFPDPVTKICWDNYLVVSPKYAESQKLKQGQMVEIKVAGKQVTVPVHVQPGVHEKAVGLAVGYGRSAAGKVADGVGVNAFKLAKFDGKEMISAGLDYELKATKQSIPLASVQDHHSMEGRQIVVEATLDQFMKKPSAGIHKHKVFSMWNKHKYPGHKWAMTIDLSKCTGCSACMISCQSENNIPVVGKKYILQGREMHWIRVDRYFTGEPENPGVVYQPIACMHCDNAPCETVCPVIATSHTDEGLNQMTYNRCVGTRYCANNCPYKVRRFNWFDYTEIRKPTEMALNPEVTVRARGVMEKCTFCFHKIRGAKEQAKQDGRTLVDGDVKTACQEACPADAIVFGDMNDPESKISKSLGNERTYGLIEEVNAQPNLKFLTKIRNTKKLKNDHAGNSGGHH